MPLWWKRRRQESAKAALSIARSRDSRSRRHVVQTPDDHVWKLTCV
jgi:hypothetical protein